MGDERTPLFIPRKLTRREIAICQTTIDSQALVALVLHHIESGDAVSVVRESDGEQCILALLKGESKTKFLRDEKWLERYGLAGADLTHIANELLRAGNEATYFGPAIAGLSRAKYNLYRHFPNRRGNFISVFYHRQWAHPNILPEILNATSVMVLHRDHDVLAKNLKDTYKIKKMRSHKLSSWKDHADVHAAVKESDAQLILMSGGPSGKALAVDLAKQYDRIVLDVGEGLVKSWCKRAKESIPRR